MDVFSSSLDEEPSEDAVSTKEPSDDAMGVGASKLMGLRLKFLSDVKETIAQSVDHLARLKGQDVGRGVDGDSATNVVDVDTSMVGMSVVVRAGPGSAAVLRERRVCRLSAVVFEVRLGSKPRSFARKLARGSHKRRLWLLNEELVVSKEVGGVFYELCRENVRTMRASKSVVDSNAILSMEFSSGFLFDAHFETEAELDLWVENIRDTSAFPYGVPFADDLIIHDADAPFSPPSSGSGAVPPPAGMTKKGRRLDPSLIEMAETYILQLQGLCAAQDAALRSVDGNGVVSKPTKKRQVRMQRLMFALLRVMSLLSVQALGGGGGGVEVQNGAKPSVQDGSSAVDEGFPTGLKIGGVSVDTMASSDSGTLQLRRQLAARDLEVAKLKMQLHSLANETWKKNLAVAELKNAVNQKVTMVSSSRGSRTVGERDEEGPTNTQPKHCLLDLLPEAVILHILGFCEARGVLAFAQCSRHAHRLSQTNVVWAVLVRRLLGSAEMPEACAALGSPKAQAHYLLSRGPCDACESFEGRKMTVGDRGITIICCAKPSCLDMLTLTVAEAMDLFLLEAADVSRLPFVVEGRVARRAAQSASLNKYGTVQNLEATRRIQEMRVEKKRKMLALKSLGNIITRPVLNDTQSPQQRRQQEEDPLSGEESDEMDYL